MKIAVIPARGGSKRIPRKNIRSFCGKPMIAWSIEAAIQSACFDIVLVSTDDPEIAEVARGLGATVPFMRPAELADDFTGTLPVMRHAAEAAQRLYGPAEHFCCIYATAPFLSADDLRFGLGLVSQPNIDYAFSVTQYPYPVQRALRLSDGSRVSMLQPEMFAMRSQDLAPVWHDAAQFYWGTEQAWSEERVIFSARSLGVRLPRHRVQDIDTPDDWLMAELMHRAIGERG